MRLEIPECRRCCCCLPLRRGVLVFGYLNLVFSVFIVVIETLDAFEGVFLNHTVMFRGVHFYAHVWFAAVLYLTEIAFNIVLLVGAHMKRTDLMRAYYYYGITTTLASLITFFVLWLNSVNTCTACYWSFYIVQTGFVLCGVGIQVYLLLLIRSELLKIRQNSCLCYVNHASEMVVDTPLQTGHNPF
ncbi:uncharacterized protein LOC123873348 [Maniola jurtina]|uniref:uncharacterized protein LOC123873348 n=1 Tax=Maniola jurtina TaxID=191418 RepID=UPI001E688976|nr:uncharacterized protein LOC123873348 [Maniola jurtina]